MPTFEDALLIACEAHRGQKDRYGQPYILHPLRVMARMRTEEERMVAILHDVVEDTPWTLDQLRDRGFSGEVVAAVEALTKLVGEPYEQLIARAGDNPLARKVKLADLEDNMDLRRVTEITEADLERLRKYRRAWGKLSAL
jgi:(p)ppGpp synthase/HD superfamily hydrolase